MADKLDVAMPDNLVIGDGWRIVFAAVDPTTGADVSGVVVSNVSVVADELVGASGGIGNPILVGISV